MAQTGLDYEVLRQKLDANRTRQPLYRAIVDTPFEFKVEMALLHLGIIVLLLADKSDGLVHRVALSNTELAKGTTDISVKRFEDIKIPLDHPENIISKAIRSGRPQLTTDWQYLFTPVLTPEEARFNQAGGAIACSAVYPLIADNWDGGALIFSYYQYPELLGPAQRQFMKTYSALAASRLSTINE